MEKEKNLEKILKKVEHLPEISEEEFNKFRQSGRNPIEIAEIVYSTDGEISTSVMYVFGKQLQGKNINSNRGNAYSHDTSKIPAIICASEFTNGQLYCLGKAFILDDGWYGVKDYRPLKKIINSSNHIQ